MKNYFVHANAIVETNNIGKDTKIWAFVNILLGAKIGKRVNICDHCFIENDVVIGNDVTIKCGVFIWDGVVVENKVFIGPSVVFVNDLLPRSKNRDYERKRILLKEGCSVGAGSVILGGLVVGKYAMVGAGAVVVKDVPDFGLVYGNPSVLKGYICVCAKKLYFVDKKNLYRCECGRKYKFEDEKVESLKIKL